MEHRKSRGNTRKIKKMRRDYIIKPNQFFSVKDLEKIFGGKVGIGKYGIFVEINDTTKNIIKKILCKEDKNVT